MNWQIAVCCILSTSVFPQAHAAEGQNPENAWVKGSPIRHPEQFSGLWETEVDHKIIGIQIVLTTTVRGSPKSLVGVDQFFHHAELEIFEQRGHTRANGEGNWFEDNSEGLEWAGNHLKIKSAGAPKHGLPEVQIDLQFDPRKESWTGRFHRGTVDQEVTLRRPKSHGELQTSPFVGTWKRTGAGMNNCLHIAQESDGTLVGWSDDLVAPGVLRYASGLKRPEEWIENYGSVANVTATQSRGVLIEFKALTAICCPIFAGGKLDPDGQSMRTDINSSNPSKWKRVRSDSCISE
jgi:hypothetical protein